MDTEKVTLKHRDTGAVLFETEIEVGLSDGRKIGAAVRMAFSRGADLDGAYLRGAYLRGAYLRGADFDGAYLRGANLDGADLRGADLRGADLRGADFDGAYLDGADLRGAYLRGADFDGAYLRGANLDGADLGGAYLGGAINLLDIGSPNGWRLVVVKHDGSIRIGAGCRWFTWAAAVEHWRDRSDRAETRAALDYIRVLCAIRGWPLGSEKTDKAA